MSANTLTVRGFVSKIDRVAGDEPKKDKYFFKLSYANGDGTNRQTQYLSCFVSKSLNRLAAAAYESQTEEEDGKYMNVLGSQPVEMTIVNPFFKINDGGYLEGTGIVTSVSFLTPEIKSKSS